MAKESRVTSQVSVKAEPERIWKEITDVDIAKFSHPRLFQVLGIPKPLRAVIEKEGMGGTRTAYFDNGKSFAQKITHWEPFKNYSFEFQPEPGFRAGYLFDLGCGPFRILRGAYSLAPLMDFVRLTLTSDYSLDGPAKVLRQPIHFVLRLFQRFLLESIRRNSEL